jgi:predicted nucleic acid-binding protein
VRVFIDTNLWVYRLDQREPEKSRRISVWLREIAGAHGIEIVPFLAEDAVLAAGLTTANVAICRRI